MKAAWPNDSRPVKPSSRLKAQAKIAKHSAFITKTGYRPMKGADQQHGQHRAPSAHARAWRLSASARSSHFSLPNRPAGRIISTMAMITKTTMLDASG